jgi:CheY-like chemotaxis protein
LADILIVDDDEIIRDTLKELLSEQYACQTAGTADEAFARLIREALRPRLTDISMPGYQRIGIAGKSTCSISEDTGDCCFRYQ